MLLLKCQKTYLRLLRYCICDPKTYLKNCISLNMLSYFIKGILSKHIMFCK